jgi:phage-related protein
MDTGTLPHDRRVTTPRQRGEPVLGLLGVVIPSVIAFLAAIISAAGDSLSGIISSIGTAFATLISSGLSAITGDQVVQIIGTIITVLGTIAATYLGIRWNRRGRNQ